MKTLDIYKPYIKGFEKDNHICFFEGFGGFWAYQEPELIAKIKEFEEKHNVLVYAVTHEYLEFDECYDFLFIKEPTTDNAGGSEYKLSVLRRFRNFAELAYGAETIKTNEVTVIDKREIQTSIYRKIGCGLSL